LTSKRVKQTSFPFDSFFRPGFKENLFLSVYDLNQLLVNIKLKSLTIISSMAKQSSDTTLNISFELLINYSNANFYLYLNNKKWNKFYSVTSGEYNCRNIMRSVYDAVL
jgi:hypothetical protein